MDVCPAQLIEFARVIFCNEDLRAGQILRQNDIPLF